MIGFIENSYKMLDCLYVNSGNENPVKASVQNF